MTQFEFYSEAEIVRMYFMTCSAAGQIPSPRETLEHMMDVLEKRLSPDGKRRTEFIKRAALSRGEIPCDISEMIMGSPECWG